MKKAVIQTGGKQYLVSEGELVSVELLKDAKDGKVAFDALLVIDGDKATVGTPTVSGATVKADVVSEDEQEDKVTSIRYKAKKRVHTVRGHRQRKTVIKISQIS
jgi:large subunit ribosomal protein L21